MNIIDAFEKILYSKRRFYSKQAKINNKYRISENSLNRFINGLPDSVNLHSKQGIPMDLFIESKITEPIKPIYGRYKYDFGIADNTSAKNLSELYDLQLYLIHHKPNKQSINNAVQLYPVNIHGQIKNEIYYTVKDEELTKLINWTRLYKIGKLPESLVSDIIFFAENTDQNGKNLAYNFLSGICIPSGKKNKGLKTSFDIDLFIESYRTIEKDGFYESQALKEYTQYIHSLSIYNNLQEIARRLKQNDIKSASIIEPDQTTKVDVEKIYEARLKEVQSYIASLKNMLNNKPDLAASYMACKFNRSVEELRNRPTNTAPTQPEER